MINSYNTHEVARADWLEARGWFYYRLRKARDSTHGMHRALGLIEAAHKLCMEKIAQSSEMYGTASSLALRPQMPELPSDLPRSHSLNVPADRGQRRLWLKPWNELLKPQILSRLCHRPRKTLGSGRGTAWISKGVRMVGSFPDAIALRHYLAKAIEAEQMAKSCVDGQLRAGFFMVAKGWRTLAAGQVDRTARRVEQTEPEERQLDVKKAK
jgi:hypothetical protein